MTDLTEMLNRIRLIANTELPPAGDVTADHNLRDLPGAESVKLLRIVGAVEELYDVEVDDEAMFGSVYLLRDLAIAVQHARAEQPDDA